VLRKEPILQDEVFKGLEKIPTTICDDDTQASCRAASLIAEVIGDHNARGKPTVLGLATGSTPIGVYRELIRLHREEQLDFSNVVTFNLDEYVPMPPDSLQSYTRWMRENFFDHVNIRPENIHIPDGTLKAHTIAEYCRRYEEAIRKAGGIDVQLLGIGRTGHIGFNEPGSRRDSRTRLISLDRVTRLDAASDFFGESHVPLQAITMGVGTILDARRILLLAFGEQKSRIIQRAVEGPVTDTVAASFLQEHPHAEVILDRPAAEDLARMATPWLLGEIDWTAEHEYRAVLWLSETAEKSILKLGKDDYENNHLASLLRQEDDVDKLNHRTARRLFNTLVRQGMLPTGKRMLCFSPHPDDDVISMGGTLTRLVKRGCEVHVAYMVSGNIAVFDEYAFQMLEFWADLNQAIGCECDHATVFFRKVKEWFAHKDPGAVDIPEAQELKAQLRRSEALAACRFMGIPARNAHFLDLPFYQTGEVRKRPIGPEDVESVYQLIQKLRPQWVFLAGELSDPHGTHRLCAEAIYAAVNRCSPETRPEIIWLYRGAWQEWEPHVIDMAVPLSRGELTHKIFGIFKHQSQKDKALFPGPYDDREFWQRAEARNTDTANIYNRLGLPEHHAMEAFARYGG
jgi:glucosamine-6-phosphate deaminase